MIKLIATVVTGLTALVPKACDEPPAADTRCVVWVNLFDEPTTYDDIAGVDRACRVNIVMSPLDVDGLTPAERCTDRWGGDFTTDANGVPVCNDIA